MKKMFLASAVWSDLAFNDTKDQTCGALRVDLLLQLQNTFSYTNIIIPEKLSMPYTNTIMIITKPFAEFNLKVPSRTVTLQPPGSSSTIPKDIQLFDCVREYHGTQLIVTLRSQSRFNRACMAATN